MTTLATINGIPTVLGLLLSMQELFCEEAVFSNRNVTDLRECEALDLVSVHLSYSERKSYFLYGSDNLRARFRDDVY